MMMYAAGGGRLEIVAADAAVDQRADPAGINARCFDGPLAADDALLARPHAPRPEPALADAADQFQPAFGELEPLIERREASFDFGAGQHFLGERVAERFQANVLISHDELRAGRDAETIQPIDEVPRGKWRG